MNKYFTLSDIHNQMVSLSLFEKQGFDINDENHHIILLGDYFDRRKGGSYQVLLFLEELLDKIPGRVVLIRGNHDVFIEDFVNDVLNSSQLFGHLEYDVMDYKLWCANGGAVTVRELFGGVSASAILTPAKLKRFRRIKGILNNLVSYHETEEYIFTHARIDENREVDYEDRNFIYSYKSLGKKVIIGHTPFVFLDGGYINYHFEESLNGVYAYNALRKNDIYCIDSGQGNNVVVWKENIEKRSQDE